MPLPSVTFRSELPHIVRKELDQFDGELTEYMLNEHDGEGHHKDITATSITVDNGHGSVTIKDGAIIADNPGAGPTPPNQLDGALKMRGWIHIDPVETTPVPLPTLTTPVPPDGQLQLGTVGTSAIGTGGGVGPGLRTRAQVPSYVSDWAVVASADPLLLKPCLSVVHQGSSPLGAGLPLLIRANDNGGTTPGFEIIPSYVTEGSKKVNLGSHTQGYGSNYEGFTEVNGRKLYAREALYERQRTVPVGEWQAYSPTWGSESTAPTLGNGNLVGRYQVTGRTCTVLVQVTFGSTTSAGAGRYYWTLPIANAGVYMGTAWVYRGSPKVGIATYANFFIAAPAGSFLVILADGSMVGAANPSGWVNGDVITATITYEI